MKGLVTVVVLGFVSSYPFADAGVLQLPSPSSLEASKLSDKGKRITFRVAFRIFCLWSATLIVRSWEILFFQGPGVGLLAFPFFFLLSLAISPNKGLCYMNITYWRWWQAGQGEQITVFFIFPTNISCEVLFCIAILVKYLSWVCWKRKPESC